MNFCMYASREARLIFHWQVLLTDVIEISIEAIDTYRRGVKRLYISTAPDPTTKPVYLLIYHQ